MESAFQSRRTQVSNAIPTFLPMQRHPLDIMDGLRGTPLTTTLLILAYWPIIPPAMFSYKKSRTRLHILALNHHATHFKIYANNLPKATMDILKIIAWCADTVRSIPTRPPTVQLYFQHWYLRLGQPRTARRTPLPNPQLPLPHMEVRKIALSRLHIHTR